MIASNEDWLEILLRLLAGVSARKNTVAAHLCPSCQPLSQSTRTYISMPSTVTANATLGSKVASPASRSAARKSKSTCPICLDRIVDATTKKEGQDSVHCDGQCNAWIHRQCAGLSSSAFDVVRKSTGPFYCPHCRLDIQAKEINSLVSVKEGCGHCVLSGLSTPTS